MKAIRTKYLGPTNTRGARILATDDDGNRTTIPYPYQLSGELVHRQAALALCRKLGWAGELTAGGLGNGYVYVWQDPTATFCSLPEAGMEKTA